jgi:hypothetical protein
VLLLLILNRLEGRAASKAKIDVAREAHRALRARLGA